MFYAKIDTATNYLMTRHTQPDVTWLEDSEYVEKSPGVLYHYYVDPTTPDYVKEAEYEKEPQDTAAKDILRETNDLLPDDIWIELTPAEQTEVESDRAAAIAVINSPTVVTPPQMGAMTRKALKKWGR